MCERTVVHYGRGARDITSNNTTDFTKLIHFPACKVLRIELDEEFNFERCAAIAIQFVDESIAEIERRFEEVEPLRASTNKFV